nr:RNA-directed DNA polymerase, eukaryota, reverse transcriptase zinc-binding domain protein [Tanacetum cinerariifolium]
MAQPTARNHAQRGPHKQYVQMTLPNPQRHVVPAAVLTQSKFVPINVVRPVSTAVPKLSVTRPRQAKTVVTKSISPPRRHINHSPSLKASTSPPRVTAIKALMVCDKKNSVLFTDTECLVFSPEFKLPDENQVLLRVPRENNMYNVNLKSIVPSRDLTRLFAKATIDEILDIKIQYLGELWVMLDFVSESSLKSFRDNICLCGMVSWIRAKEMPRWVLDFKIDSNDEEQDEEECNNGGSKNYDTGIGGNDSDVEEVSDTVFEKMGDTGNKEKSEAARTGGSILNVLEEVVKVRQVMGGEWCLTGKEVLFVAVYAPHDFKEKQTFWDYLIHEIGKWNGEVVIMGTLMRYATNRIDAWKEKMCDEVNAMKKLMGKLKHLKAKIREWNKVNMVCMNKVRTKYKEDLATVDAIIDYGNGNEEIVEKRMGIINDLQNVNKLHLIEMKQKAKIKWPIEGDKNSRYFHGLINKKTKSFEYPGCVGGGESGYDSDVISEDFLSLDQQLELENKVSNEEVTKAVWDCGTDKAPGPYGFTFGFYRKFRYLIEGDWCRDKKKHALIFKVDFEKAYDSVRWKFLDEILKKFGFGAKLCYWIQSCLKSSRGSIIINGSPTDEFQFFRGLKQRGLLSPFLFILIMESLHLSFEKVMEAGSMPIYHMLMIKVPIRLLNTLESIRSHFFNGHDLNSKKASWVNWKKVLASKEKRGLSVSSFYELNISLLFKWVWRFYTQSNSLWVRVIKAIHGDDDNIGANPKAGSKSCWMNIVHELNVLCKKRINLREHMSIKVGNDNNTIFWEDNWIGGTSLKLRYPRLYTLENEKMIPVGMKFSHHSLVSLFRREPRGGIEQVQLGNLMSLVQEDPLAPMEDRWKWDLVSSGDFSVASARMLIDGKTIPEVGSRTRWVSMACQVSRLIMRWWDIPIEEFVSYKGWFDWFSRLRLPSKNKLMLEGVFYVLWWHLWAFRNRKLFDAKIPLKEVFYDEVVSMSFHWCRYR